MQFTWKAGGKKATKNKILVKVKPQLNHNINPVIPGLKHVKVSCLTVPYVIFIKKVSFGGCCRVSNIFFFIAAKLCPN